MPAWEKIKIQDLSHGFFTMDVVFTPLNVENNQKLTHPILEPIYHLLVNQISSVYKHQRWDLNIKKIKEHSSLFTLARMYVDLIQLPKYAYLGIMEIYRVNIGTEQIVAFKVTHRKEGIASEGQVKQELCPCLLKIRLRIYKSQCP